MAGAGGQQGEHESAPTYLASSQIVLGKRLFYPVLSRFGEPSWILYVVLGPCE